MIINIDHKYMHAKTQLVSCLYYMYCITMEGLSCMQFVCRRDPQTFSCEGEVNFPFSDGGRDQFVTKKCDDCRGVKTYNVIVFRKTQHNQASWKLPG